MGKKLGAAAALRHDVQPITRAVAALPWGDDRRDVGDAPSLRVCAAPVADTPFGFEKMIGASAAVRNARTLLQKIARTASTILLTGESGTGKDLAAKIIHHNSDRAGKPFMNITCSALQDSLLESELFGHERGAFTDAKTQRKGLLELASGGTVFLDEIGEMSLGLQAKVLRFLEDKSFKRVGGNQDIQLDVRIIAATNRNLETEVRAGRFREDLYYRLRVVPMVLPPLRERTGDVALLGMLFLHQFAREFAKPVHGVTAAAQAMLEAHRWPGNVRELKHAMHRAVLLCDDEDLVTEDFVMVEAQSPSPAHVMHLPDAGLDFDALASDLVLQAIERASGNQTHAATLLTMTRDQMRYRLEKLGWSGKRHGLRPV